MKKVLCLMIGVAHLVTASVCAAYQAECMNTKGKFSNCDVEVNDGTLHVAYKSKKWQKLDKTIPGSRITALSGGEYARRRVAESVTSAVLLGPLFLFALFAKKKRDNFGIEYMTDNGNKDAVLVQVKKKYGFALGQQLETISGKKIVVKDSGKEQKTEYVAEDSSSYSSYPVKTEQVTAEPVQEEKPTEKKTARSRSSKYRR
jgi:hypothetical protein